MSIKRFEGNPVITPDMVKPSNPGYEVKGVFNPGAAVHGEEIILLLRVSETCVQKKGFARVPVMNMKGKHPRADIFDVSLSDRNVKLKDKRGIVYKGVDYLSTMSHIRLARSRDGRRFRVDRKPFIFPVRPEEVFGVEDVRATRIDGVHYLCYTAVSSDSWATALASTADFVSLERHGLIFCPENKDVCVFPAKTGGKYYALHRPDNSGFGRPSIWLAASKDLIHWGEHRCIARPRENYWEKLKIGAGPPPVRVPEGWLVIYHAKGGRQVYSLFAMLLDAKDPSRVIARSDSPIFVPEAEYEKNGFFANCVFCNGIVVRDNGELLLYYGACDNYTCLAETTVSDVMSVLRG